MILLYHKLYQKFQFLCHHFIMGWFCLLFLAWVFWGFFWCFFLNFCRLLSLHTPSTTSPQDMVQVSKELPGTYDYHTLRSNPKKAPIYKITQGCLPRITNRFGFKTFSSVTVPVEEQSQCKKIKILLLELVFSLLNPKRENTKS